MRFHIVRHGQTDWNVQRRIQGQLDSELNAQGIEQAIERGKDFADMPIHAIYCSSSLRTRQTLEHMLGARQQPATFMDEFREVNWGVWQGSMWSEIEAAEPEMVEAFHKALPHYSVENAETPLQTQSRGVDAFEGLIAKHQHDKQDANILLVSHGDIMKKMLGHYTSVPLTELHTLPPLPNCAHCIIDVDGDRRTVTHIAGEQFAQTPWAQLLS